MLQFAVFYSFSVLLAVMTRSTAACAFGTTLLWLLSWGINHGRVMARGLPEYRHLTPFTLAAAEAAYTIYPKPIDAGLILFNALDARHHFDMPLIFKLTDSVPSYSPLLSIISTLVIAGVLLGLSAHEFNAADY